MKNKKVYVVEFGAFDDWESLGYFKNEQDALEYCAIKNKDGGYDKYCVYEIPMLDKLDTECIDFKYLYCATISLKKDGNEIYKHYKEMYCGKTKKTKFDLQFDKYKWFRIQGTFESWEECIRGLNSYYSEFKKYVEEGGEAYAIEELKSKIERIDVG